MSPRLRALELSLFTRQLATLLASGVNLAVALDVLARSPEQSPGAAAALSQLQRH